MAVLSPKVYFFILLCTWISCQFFVPSDSRSLFRRVCEFFSTFYSFLLRKILTGNAEIVLLKTFCKMDRTK